MKRISRPPLEADGDEGWVRGEALRPVPLCSVDGPGPSIRKGAKMPLRRASRMVHLSIGKKKKRIRKADTISSEQ